MRYLFCAAAILVAGFAAAEPYLAVQTGYTCNVVMQILLAPSVSDDNLPSFNREDIVLQAHVFF